MPRSKLPPRRDVHLRIPEEVLANVILLRPELIDPGGQFRYGAINAYFLKLLQRDIEARLQHLATAAQQAEIRSLKDRYLQEKKHDEA